MFKLMDHTGLKVSLRHLPKEALFDAANFCYYTLILILTKVLTCKHAPSREKK